MSLKRLYYETRLKCRMLKKEMKDQRQKSRALMVSCAIKLHEKEVEMEQVI